MKKILILVIVLLAALDNFGQLTLGPKIGYTTSKLSSDVGDIKESVNHNFQIGAFVRFGKKLYVQPELYYATSGGTLKVNGLSGTDDIKIKLNNLSIPVLVGYKIINAKVVNLRIMAGPVANFILDKKVDAEVVLDYLEDSDFKNVAWGIDVGAGVDVFFLTLDLRYEFGLNNIYNPPDNAKFQSIKSNVFIVSLGFKLL